jgi:hypothetical protein
MLESFDDEMVKKQYLDYKRDSKPPSIDILSNIDITPDS